MKLSVNFTGRFESDRRSTGGRPPLIRGTSSMMKRSIVLPELNKCTESQSNMWDVHHDNIDRGIPDGSEEVFLSLYVSLEHYR